MATMTKADLEALVADIVGKKIKELQEQNQSWVKDIFAAMQEAKAQDHRLRSQGAGLMAGRYIRALAAGKGDPDRASRFVRQVWRDEAFAKALSESVFSDGGAIVPDEYVAEIIELLRARAVVRQLGATPLPMNSGSLSIPRQTAGATASYVGENKPISPSQLATGQIQLSAKKLAALVPISNDLLRDASPSADALVRDDLVVVMALREDLAFLRDDGTQNQPKGIRYWANAAHVFAFTQAGAEATILEITADLAKMVRLIEESNVPMVRMGWIFTPRVKWFLMSRRDGNGNLVWDSEMRNGTLMGIPFRTTTQVPNNLGVASNETEITLADFAQAIIGENTQMMIDASTEAAYQDGANVIAAFSLDQTVVRAIARHDFALRHDRAAAIGTQVKYGAA